MSVEGITVFDTAVIPSVWINRITPKVLMLLPLFVFCPVLLHTFNEMLKRASDFFGRDKHSSSYHLIIRANILFTDN